MSDNLQIHKPYEIEAYMYKTSYGVHYFKEIYNTINNNDNNRRHPWYSGSALDCWSTLQAIDPAPEAYFITKLISLAQVIPGPV